jgi:hypothetical protein
MGSRLTEIVVDCHDPVAQAASWAAALDDHLAHSQDAQVAIATWEREPPDPAEQVRQAASVPARGVWISPGDRRPAAVSSPAWIHDRLESSTPGWAG